MFDLLYANYTSIRPLKKRGTLESHFNVKLSWGLAPCPFKNTTQILPITQL